MDTSNVKFMIKKSHEVVIQRERDDLLCLAGFIKGKVNYFNIVSNAILINRRLSSSHENVIYLLIKK